MNRGVTRGRVAAGIGLALHGVAGGLVIATWREPFTAWGLRGGTVVLGLLLGVIALLLTVRKPENRLGRLLAAAALPLGVNTIGVYVDMLLAARGMSLTGLAVGVVDGLWAPGIMTILLAFAAFPDGRLPSGWTRRLVGGLYVASTIGLLVASALTDVHMGAGSSPPLVADDIVAPLYLAFPAYVVSVVVTVVRRFRASTGAARQQFRWVAYAFVLYAVTSQLVLVDDRLSRIGATLSVLTIGLLFVAFAMAILRYRLYDLDRIVSRTVAYVLLTGAVVGLWALVALLPTVLFDLAGPGGEPNSALVAGATLLAALSFNPLRRRFQELIDRRLNRARFDARREVEALGSRLAERVDPDAVRRDVVEVLGRTLAPAAVAVWAPPRTEVSS